MEPHGVVERRDGAEPRRRELEPVRLERDGEQRPVGDVRGQALVDVALVCLGVDGPAHLDPHESGWRPRRRRGVERVRRRLAVAHVDGALQLLAEPALEGAVRGEPLERFMNVVAVAGQALRRRYALGHGVLVLWRRRVARQAAVHVKARDHLEDDVWILELSSFQIESLPTFSPELFALLNLTMTHEERYKSREEYLEAKIKLADQIYPKVDDGALIRGEPVEDPRLASYWDRVGGSSFAPIK